MSIMKTIQPTPELSGKDAEKLLVQVNMKPTAQAEKKNNVLLSVLNSIRK